MTRKELDIIVESTVKAIASSLPMIIRKIVREEIELNESLQNSKFINENKIKNNKFQKSERLNSQKYQKRKIVESDLNKIFENGNVSNIFSETKKSFPSTGINLLDEYIKSAPSEKEISDNFFGKNETKISNNPIPIEEIYMNDVKKVSVDDAQNIDYSSFLEQMNNISSDKGSSIPIGVNPRALYVKDPSTILQEQSVGTPRVEKTYKA